MSVTAEYARIHHAFQLAADASDLLPFDVRVLVAIADLGGEAVRSDMLEWAIGGDASAIRRSLARLYRDGLADAVGEGGGRRRPGVRSLVSLTADGQRVWWRFQEARA